MRGFTLLPISAALVLVQLLAPTPTSAATLEQWRSRTIYQIVTDRFARPLHHGDERNSGTEQHGAAGLLDASSISSSDCNVVDGLYCGGTWSGISAQLDYIQGMHFDAIWISPVVAQLPQNTADGEAYMGYWAQDLYALNDNFGTDSELRALIADVHARGMYVMLDVVVNHMGYSGNPQNVDYSVFNPFNSSTYFHPYCPITNDTNQTNVEHCWLGDDAVPLVDLCTECSEVSNIYGGWISELVGNYSFDGLRIDTALNVEASFFPEFVKRAGVFATGELMDGDASLVCQWASEIGSILNYPIYYPLVDAFSSEDGNINNLVAEIYSQRKFCQDTTALGSFSENQDVPRFATLSGDLAQAKNVLAFTLLADGIPIVYQGQEQHMAGGTSPYWNRTPLWTTNYNTTSPLYNHTATLVQARQAMINNTANYTTSLTNVIYSDYHTFALRKGNTTGSHGLTVLTNNGIGTDNWTLTLNQSAHAFSPDTHLTEILACTSLTVSPTGTLHIPMGEGLPKVIYPSNLLRNSDLCGNTPSDTSGGGNPSPTPSNTLPASTSTSTPTPAKSDTRSRTRADLFAVISICFLAIIAALHI